MSTKGKETQGTGAADKSGPNQEFQEAGIGPINCIQVNKRKMWVRVLVPVKTLGGEFKIYRWVKTKEDPDGPAADMVVKRNRDEDSVEEVKEPQAKVNKLESETPKAPVNEEEASVSELHPAKEVEVKEPGLDLDNLEPLLRRPILHAYPRENAARIEESLLGLAGVSCFRRVF